MDLGIQAIDLDMVPDIPVMGPDTAQAMGPDTLAMDLDTGRVMGLAIPVTTDGR